MNVVTLRQHLVSKRWPGYLQIELTSRSCERKQTCGESHITGISVVADVLENAIIFGLKPNPLHLLVQTSNACTAGVPFSEVSVRGRWGAAGPEILAG